MPKNTRKLSILAGLVLGAAVLLAAPTTTHAEAMPGEGIKFKPINDPWIAGVFP